MSDSAIWSLPHKSQEFAKGPRVRQDTLENLVIAYDYELEDGRYEWTEFGFLGVIAFRFTLVGYCSLEQIHAFDEVRVVVPSAWLAALLRPPDDVAHFRIYFDDIGSYEVLARKLVTPDGRHLDPFNTEVNR